MVLKKFFGSSLHFELSWTSNFKALETQKRQNESQTFKYIDNAFYMNPNYGKYL